MLDLSDAAAALIIEDAMERQEKLADEAVERGMPQAFVDRTIRKASYRMFIPADLQGSFERWVGRHGRC